MVTKKQNGTTAIHVRTESCDHYIFMFKGKLSDKKALQLAKEELGEEGDYVSDYNVTTTILDGNKKTKRT